MIGLVIFCLDRGVAGIALVGGQVLHWPPSIAASAGAASPLALRTSGTSAVNRRCNHRVDEPRQIAATSFMRPVRRR